MKDRVFNKPIVKKFEFDEAVASVFDDMLTRSIPFYDEVRKLIISIILVEQEDGKRVLDLGSSTAKFLLDLDRVVGKSLQLDHGDYIISITPQMAYLTLKIVDPYNTSLILPPEEAPDGKTDYMLIKFVLNNALKNSLIVIEEPEIYKNPLFQFEMMDEISKLALDKNLTVVMTTHSEIIPLSIAKLVEVGKLKPDDVRIYYLTRSKEEPWTKIRKIDVYEDGTLEELPDSEKITAQLF